MTTQPIAPCHPTADRLTARCIAGIPAIEAIGNAWHELALARPANRPFAGPGFVIAALKAFHADDNAALCVVERDGALDAVMPFVDRPLRRAGLRIAEIGCPDNPHVLVNDALLPADGVPARRAATSLMTGLLGTRCDTVILQHLPGLAAADLMTAAASDSGFTCAGLERSRDLHFVACKGTYDDYLATRSGDFRRQLKKHERRATEAGGFALEIVTGREKIAAAFPIWFEIEKKSWQGEAPGAAMSDADRRFMGLLLRELADDEVGELWLLRIGGEPAAALRMLGGTGRTCVHTMHFDQKFKALTPGTLLLNAMLKSAWDRGLQEVDFHGNSAHYRRWATDKREHFTARLYKPGLLGLMLKQGRRIWKLMQKSPGAASHD